jgi:hypothetical protein
VGGWESSESSSGYEGDEEDGEGDEEDEEGDEEDEEDEEEDFACDAALALRYARLVGGVDTKM